MDQDTIFRIIALPIRLFFAFMIGWFIRNTFFPSKGECARRTLKKMSREQWMQTSVTFFRSMEFFSMYKQQTNEEVIKGLEDRYRRESFGNQLDIDPQYQFVDLNLTRLDDKRVWWHDAECVDPGQGFFKKIIQEWAAISRGAFQPTDIIDIWPKHDEEWEGELDDERWMIQISFTLKGVQRQIKARFMGDWLDITALNQINEMIKDTGYQYMKYDTKSQDVYIVVLTEGEKQKLINERGWKFSALE